MIPRKFSPQIDCPASFHWEIDPRVSVWTLTQLFLLYEALFDISLSFWWTLKGLNTQVILGKIFLEACVTSRLIRNSKSSFLKGNTNQHLEPEPTDYLQKWRVIQHDRHSIFEAKQECINAFILSNVDLLMNNCDKFHKGGCTTVQWNMVGIKPGKRNQYVLREMVQIVGARKTSF